MRMIQFRVWDMELNIMLTPENQIGGLWSIKEAHNGIVRYNRGILMQYTGVTDSAGKYIYEKDIVEVEYGKGRVVYNNRVGAFMIEWSDDRGASMELLNEHKLRIRKCTIIGNQFETPELL